MLELKGLTRRYGDVVALDDLSFTVAEGQLFGFVGPNGAGKTPPLEQRAPRSLRSDRVDQGRFGGEVQDLADPWVPAGS